MVATTYFWDPIEDNVAKSVESSGAETYYNSDPNHLGETLAFTTGEGHFFLHADGIGSVISISGTSQALVGAWSYNAFGEIQEAWGTNTPNLKYWGVFGAMQRDGVQVDARNRSFNTSEIRWLSRPMGSWVLIYAYSFWLNNPIRAQIGIGDPGYKPGVSFSDPGFGNPLIEMTARESELLRGCKCAATRMRINWSWEYGIEATVICSGKEFKPILNPDNQKADKFQQKCRYNECTESHEGRHILHNKMICPNACKDFDANFGCISAGNAKDVHGVVEWIGANAKECLRVSECFANIFGMKCMIDRYREFMSSGNKDCVKFYRQVIPLKLNYILEKYRCELPQFLKGEMEGLFPGLILRPRKSTPRKPLKPPVEVEPL